MGRLRLAEWSMDTFLLYSTKVSRSQLSAAICQRPLRHLHLQHMYECLAMTPKGGSIRCTVGNCFWCCSKLAVDAMCARFLPAPILAEYFCCCVMLLPLVLLKAGFGRYVR